jgi:hypothetical protein
MSALSLPTPAHAAAARRPLADRLRSLFDARPRPVHDQRLVRHETVFASARQGTRIECLEGCVWITVDGELLDVVLEAGEQFTLERTGRVAVHALERAQVQWV